MFHVGESPDMKAAKRSPLASIAIVAVAMVASTAQVRQLPPFSYVPGNLTTVLLGLAIVFSLISSAMSRRTPRLLPAVVAALIFVIMGVGVINAQSGDYATFKLSRLALATMPTIVAVVLVVRDRSDVKLFMKGFFGASLYASLALRLTGSNVDLGGVAGRLQSEAGSTISFGRSAAYVIAALLVWFLMSGSVKPTRAFAALLVVGLELWIMLSVASRGPIQALILAGFTAMSFVFFRSHLHSWARGLAVGLLTSSVTLVAWAFAPEASRSRILLLGSGSSSSARTLFFRRTLEIADLSPLGHGWGSWAAAADLGGTFKYPHNVFFEIWFEAGVISLLVFCALVGYAIVLQYRRRVAEPMMSALLATSVVFWLGASLVSGDVNDNRTLFVLLVVAVIPMERARAKPGLTPGNSYSVVDITSVDHEVRL